MQNYCYLFPQKSSVWNAHEIKSGGTYLGYQKYKVQTTYWLFAWVITVTHTENHMYRLHEPRFTEGVR